MRSTVENCKGCKEFIGATEFYYLAAITKVNSDDEIVFEEATNDKTLVEIN